MSDTQRNLSTVQSIYAAFGRGDVPFILSQLREDIVWEEEAHDHGIPWLTPGKGTGHVMRFFERVGSFQFERFEVRNLLAGGDQIAAVVAETVRSRPDGQPIHDLAVHLWTFDAEGRVRAFRHVVDTIAHQRGM